MPMHPAVVSVRPYPLPGATLPAKSLPMRAIVSGDAGAPPWPMEAREDRSYLSRSGCSSNDRTTVGTPPMDDTLCFSMRRRPSVASHLYCVTMVPPNAVWLMRPHRPAMWKNGNVESDVDGGAMFGITGASIIFAASATPNRAFHVLVM